MRVLVSGGHGFAGRHLAQHLVKCGDDVALTYLPTKVAEATGDRSNENRVKIPQVCQSMALDLTDASSVDHLISLLRPDVVFHLAGQTFVPDAERSFISAFEANTFGTVYLLEALAKHAPSARFLYVSSAEVYGEPRSGALPLTEQSLLRPVSAYGVSKAAADMAAFKYSVRNDLHVVRVRPFPHIGPGQSDRFAISSFAQQVAAIKLGQADPEIKVGNLHVKRDYSDVSDIVRGYREAILNGKSGEVYNLCSGQSVEMREILQNLIELAGVETDVVVDPTRVREMDVPDVYGSYEKAQKDFGWRPRVERESMLSSLLGYWMEVLSA